MSRLHTARQKVMDAALAMQEAKPADQYGTRLDFYLALNEYEEAAYQRALDDMKRPRTEVDPHGVRATEARGESPTPKMVTEAS